LEAEDPDIAISCCRPQKGIGFMFRTLTAEMSCCCLVFLWRDYCGFSFPGLGGLFTSLISMFPVYPPSVSLSLSQPVPSH
jgi:hypothetical protein